VEIDMPAKKGVNRFESYQALKQHARVTVISEFLLYLRTSRVRHQHVTNLAEMVAKHITKKEGKPCNRSTVLRNPRYKTLLLNYMVENLAAGTKNLKVKDIYDPKTQAILLTTQLDISNLKRDNERLRTYVSQLESQIAKSNIKIGTIEMIAHENSELDFDQAQIRFVRVCQSLQRVIRHLNSVVSADINSRQIIDRSKLRNNVIVDSEISAGFFEWLEMNRGLV
jgi:hypothetical protein